jgi:hypothetical protein
LRDYEALYDAPALLDVRRIAEQDGVKGEDLAHWYHENVAELQATVFKSVRVLQAHNTTGSVFYEWFFNGL